MDYARLTLAAAALVGAASAQGQASPEVGEVAPPIGNVRWLQLDDEDQGSAPQIERLRGRVVIVHTYGHFCDP